MVDPFVNTGSFVRASVGPPGCGPLLGVALCVDDSLYAPTAVVAAAALTGGFTYYRWPRLRLPSCPSPLWWFRRYA